MKNKLTFKSFLDYGIYLVVLSVDKILNILPERIAMALGRFLGRIAYVILPDRRKAAIENLTIAFGKEKTPEWIVRISRQSFEHLGMLGVEFFRCRHWTEKELAERIIIEGRLPYNLAMAPGSNGICLLNSHFGCFEVSAATVKFLGIKLHLMVTSLKNPFLNRYLFNRGGYNTGITTHPHKGMVKNLVNLMNSGKMVAFLADQRGDAERGIFVDFFGSPAPANEAFAKMAIEGGGYVIPLCTYRLGDGRYKSIFGEEIHLQLTGDKRKDLTTVSQQFHNVFESWLRMCPEQGYWVQRKWRRSRSRKRFRWKLFSKRKAAQVSG